MKRFDCLVIGAGPAGVCAALYLARFDVRVALVEKLAPGGLLLQTSEVENYPGFPKGIKGYELADALDAQLAPYANLTRIRGEVQEMELGQDVKRVRIDDEWHEAHAVIICAGVRYKSLGLPDEHKFIGKGLSFCALCDANFFRGQKVAVVGGGNSALEESLYLAKIASEVHIIHRRDEFRGAPIYVSRLKEHANVHFEYSTVVSALHGDTALEGITLKRLHSGKEEFLPVQGMFIFIGFLPAGHFLPAELEVDENGFIHTDLEMRTKLPGVFAAGDIRAKLCRQVVTAVGDGATAANSAFTYLERKHG
ncbi:FAD-dependent oxidoreductase [Desulfovibrio sp. OttesenSCG-928-A18]|nr:FAD-dependent oxidoreductase [Desulfovibrio sp. OttesenSCG-928-A18]